jgi:hypothetical protein|tara:strand:- start:5848 stop:6066 length:219 start_codon:yes stop_codon:yes gene_type:complete
MDKEKLSSLHTVLTELLLEKIQSGEASSGDLSVARQFLRDNGIDANVNQSEPLLNLAKVLPFEAKEQIEEAG